MLHVLALAIVDESECPPFGSGTVELECGTSDKDVSNGMCLKGVGEARERPRSPAAGS